MQFPAGISRRYAVLVGGLLVTIWLWLAFDRPSLPAQIIWNTSSKGGIISPSIDAFDFPPVDSDEMRAVCSSTRWNQSLIFTCDNNHGGIGHVRNSILNCVRYAIGTGGALVLPNIALRDEDDMEHDHGHVEKRHGPGRQGMEYMFDVEHFQESLRLSCPELMLIGHMEETFSPRRRGLLPEHLFTNIPASGIEHPEEWPVRLKAWIEEYMPPYPEKEPIVIDLEQSFLHYPTHSDGHKFAHTFGNILKFRPDVRRLATTTLNKLAEWYDMPLNLSEPIMNPSFMGAHLQTDNPFLEQRHNSDIAYAHFPAQTAAYIKQAISAKIPLIYVASGNLPEIHKLGLQATASEIAVTHKEDLLKDKDMEMLERLRWDQRALVDYLVLLKVQGFAGVGHSSFSWQVVMTRHEGGDKRKGVLESDVWSDGVSTLYGVRSSYVESSECMWS
jgi:hypothetical protein